MKLLNACLVATTILHSSVLLANEAQDERTAARAAVYQENPFLRKAVGRVQGFGNAMSIAVANRMYSRTDTAALADAKNLATIEKHGDGVWLVRFPWVNVAVFETEKDSFLSIPPMRRQVRHCLLRFAPSAINPYTPSSIPTTISIICWALGHCSRLVRNRRSSPPLYSRTRSSETFAVANSLRD